MKLHISRLDGPQRYDTPSNVPTIPAPDSKAEREFDEEMLRNFGNRWGRPAKKVSK